MFFLFVVDVGLLEAFSVWVGVVVDEGGVAFFLGVSVSVFVGYG